MRPRQHRLPGDVLDRLAGGGGGAVGARHLVAAERSKLKLLTLLMVRLAAETRHPQAEAAEHAYELLAEAERKQPAAVRDVLGHPSVGAWLHATVRALDDAARLPLGPAQLGAVALVAALKAGLPCRAEVPAPGGVITLPSLGQVVLPPGGPESADLRVHADGQVEGEGLILRPDGREQPHWRPLRRLTAGDLDLLLDDLDPARWSAATVIEGRLPDDELRAWRTSLASAWDLLLRQHWTTAAETREIVRVLTPIKGPDWGMDSATTGDRFGTIAMSTPPDGRWLASTIAHEIQHAKLGAVLDVVRLLEPDEGRYYAPWRPDPRPLAGLLQGAYAYLGVSGFWRRQRAAEPDLRPHVEFARWRRSAYEVTGVLLDSGRLTGTGRRFLTGMRRTLAAWQDEPVPAEALRVARQEAETHRAAWLARAAGPGATG